MGDDNRDDTLTKILLHVGAAAEGIANLKEGMGQINGEIKGINMHLAELNHSAVRKVECDAKHEDLKASISEIRQDVRHVRKYQTGEIESLNSAQGSRPLPVLNPPDDPKPRGVLHILSIIGGLIAVLTFFGGGIWAIIEAGRYLERVERTMKVVQIQQDKVLEAAREPRIIHSYSTPPFPHPEPMPTKPRRKAPRRRPASAPTR